MMTLLSVQKFLRTDTPCLPMGLASGQNISLPDATRSGAMRYRTADGVNGVVRDKEVSVGTLGAEGVVAGHSQLLASLPPAERCSDHASVQCLLEPGLEPHAPRGCLQHGSCPVRDACRCGCAEMALHKSLRHWAPQAWDVAVLLIAKLHQSEEGEQQRVWLGHPRDTRGV